MKHRMDTTLHTKRFAGVAAVLAAAVALSFGVGSALAAPLKNAERVCVKVGGTFAGSSAQYSCSGVDSTLAFSFLSSPLRQCAHSFKGTWRFEVLDAQTGAWRYTCALA